MTRFLYDRLRAEVAALRARVSVLATGGGAPSVPDSRQVISGAGLTGGGTLAADRTLAVGAGTGITVNADDVAVNQAALKLDDFAATDDNTDLDASATKHGLMPKWTSALISALLDLISSTRGAILYRGAAAWAALNPGTSGHVLTSNGAGADPTYQAGGSGITQLTGDVTAGPGSGSQAATIANDAVTYAKLQNISAADRLLGRGNGGGSGDAQEIALGTNLSMSGTTLNATGGGGGAWELADSWTYSVDVANVDFTGLSGYSEIRVNIVDVTLSVSGIRQVLVSTDNGSTFLNTSGDYRQTDPAGSTTNAAGVGVHATASTLARSGQLVIVGFNTATANKPFDRATRTDSTTGHVVTATALDALRVIGSGGGNLTGGSIYVWGRP